jgi:hypothetical protein
MRCAGGGAADSMYLMPHRSKHRDCIRTAESGHGCLGSAKLAPDRQTWRTSSTKWHGSAELAPLALRCGQGAIQGGAADLQVPGDGGDGFAASLAGDGEGVVVDCGGASASASLGGCSPRADTTTANTLERHTPATDRYAPLMTITNRNRDLPQSYMAAGDTFGRRPPSRRKNPLADHGDHCYFSGGRARDRGGGTRERIDMGAPLRGHGRTIGRPGAPFKSTPERHDHAIHF